MINTNTGLQNFIIREASVEDTPVIITYIKKLAEYERLLDKVVLTEQGIQEFLFGEKPFAEVLLALESNNCVGFALFFHNFSTFEGRPGLYLEDLFIDPEYRGKGYGKALLKQLAAIALDRGCARFEWAVLDWNDPAIDFYKALGAVPMNEWTVFRMDENAMKKLTLR